MSRWRRAGVCEKTIKSETDNQYVCMGLADIDLDGTYTVKQLRRIADLLERHILEEEEISRKESNNE